jgi:hypothetical protein
MFLTIFLQNHVRTPVIIFNSLNVILILMNIRLVKQYSPNLLDNLTDVLTMYLLNNNRFLNYNIDNVCTMSVSTLNKTRNFSYVLVVAP